MVLCCCIGLLLELCNTVESQNPAKVVARHEGAGRRGGKTGAR